MADDPALVQTLFSLNIVSNPMAVQFNRWHTVEPWPSPKRRKRWHVVKHETTTPGCWQVGNTLIMHPDLIATLPRATK